MRKDKRRRLERAGWVIGDAGDFLNLSDDERRFIETKLALAAGLRQWREHLGLTQTEVAERFGSSQSRVAKMEAADRTVSTDLLLRSLFLAVDIVGFCDVHRDQSVVVPREHALRVTSRGVRQKLECNARQRIGGLRPQIEWGTCLARLTLARRAP